MTAAATTDELAIVGKDMIPLLEVDLIIKDARDLYARRGPALYMNMPWWEKTNRHLLIKHLCRLYDYTTKHRLPYLEMARFNNRTVYHLYPTSRVIVREISQSIGSTTLRAHFRNTHKQFEGTSWAELFALEERFWTAQRLIINNLDPAGAITKIGGKRVYTLWESLESIRKISKDRGLPAIDLLDYALFHSKPCNTLRLSTQIGSALAKGVPTIRAALPTIRSHRAFQVQPTLNVVKAPWVERLGFPNAKASGSIPLGFSLAKEHMGQRGKPEDVTDIAPTGQYRTKDGSVFQGEFWFQARKNPWLVVPVDSSNIDSVNLDTWYNPGRHDDQPTIEELTRLAPSGPWSKVWDAKTGRAISPQAGRITLKLR